MVKCYTHTKYKRAHNCHPVHLKSSGFRSKIKAKHFHQIGKSLRDRTKIEILLQNATPAGYSSGKFRSNIREIQDKPLFYWIPEPVYFGIRIPPAAGNPVLHSEYSRKPGRKSFKSIFFRYICYGGSPKTDRTGLPTFTVFPIQIFHPAGRGGIFFASLSGKERKWMRTTRG